MSYTPPGTGLITTVIPAPVDPVNNPTFNVVENRGMSYQDFDLFKITGMVEISAVILECTDIQEKLYGPTGSALLTGIGNIDFFNYTGLKNGTNFNPVGSTPAGIKPLFAAYGNINNNAASSSFLNPLVKGHVIDGLSGSTISNTNNQYPVAGAQNPSGFVEGTVGMIPGVPLSTYGYMVINGANGTIKCGEIIRGATSKASAISLNIGTQQQAFENDPAGHINSFLSNVHGTFTPGEVITGSTTGKTATVVSYATITVANPELGPLTYNIINETSPRVFRAATSGDTHYTWRFLYSQNDELSQNAQQIKVNFTGGTGTFSAGEYITSSAGGFGLISSVGTGFVIVYFVGGTSFPYFNNSDTITGFASSATGTISSIANYNPAFKASYKTTVLWKPLTPGSTVVAP